MDKNNVVQLPNKQLKSLSDNELMLAYQCVQALMEVRIPAAVSYADSGVIYDGAENTIGRYIAIVWLTIKGEAVVTKVMSQLHTHFTLEKVQALANGIHQQFMSQVQEAKAKEPANDS